MWQVQRGSDSFVTFLEPSRGLQINLSREEAKAITRFLMVEFNVVEFFYRENDKEFAGHLSDREFKKLVEERWKK